MGIYNICYNNYNRGCCWYNTITLKDKGKSFKKCFNKHCYYKDNIKIENSKDIRKIEISGAGLNDYSVLSLHYDDNSIKSTNLYFNEKSYYIDQYLSKHHKFNYNDMAKISIFISLTTIVFTIYVGRKKLVDNKK